MDFNITSATINCWNDQDKVCIIFTPPAFLSVLLPAIFTFYELYYKHHSGPITKLIGYIYGIFAFQGVLIFRLSFGRNGSLGNSKTDDIALFSIGLVVISLFTIAFTIDFVKLYRMLSTWWKLSRTIFSGSFLLLTALIFLLDQNLTYDITSVIALGWIGIETTAMTALLWAGRHWNDYKNIPQMLYIYVATTYLLWSILLWKYFASLNLSISPAIIATTAFACHIGCYVFNRLATSSKSQAQDKLLPGFGQNIREDAESELTE